MNVFSKLRLHKNGNVYGNIMVHDPSVGIRDLISDTRIPIAHFAS